MATSHAKDLRLVATIEIDLLSIKNDGKGNPVH